MEEKTGIVKTIYPDRCTARVAFEDEEDLLSDELQIVVRGSLKNKAYWMPKVGEHVFCSFTKQGKGYILGSIYSEEDKPPVIDEGKRHITFEDGTTVEYDTKTHTLSIQSNGSININAAGNINVTGDVVADGISLKNHTHTETGATTSKPIGGG
ncbi:phage baseplate assembly protein V [Cytobacillus sp. IB215665]|uniref:phage baseplate assembly protein V n=1 Tax=Cytobacillus sp. IB215665 TaxID=3097357 RepID=UPI002A17C681|nr:phage baseplate assembly protein V [Cytobacillus sp. IB215665]MDX8367788.1 phage baseplate assembly protein V [Cytobacillus sp. IB215665]